MNDGILKGVSIISLMGGSGGKLDVATLGCLEDSEGLEECVGSLCGLGLIEKKDNFLYLTKNGERVYQKLQKKYN